MSPIQLLLLVLVGLVGIIGFQRLCSRLLHRLILLGLGLSATVLIVVPNLSTRMAEWAGVGRGVDLLIYLGFVGMAFTTVILYSHVRASEERLTEVVRSIAILHAKEAVQEANTGGSKVLLQLPSEHGVQQRAA